MVFLKKGESGNLWIVQLRFQLGLRSIFVFFIYMHVTNLFYFLVFLDGWHELVVILCLAIAIT